MKLSKQASRRYLYRALVITVAVLSLTLTGCMTGRRDYQATSVVQYLYPGKKEHVEPVAVPRLVLPLRVGIAFVPAGNVSRQSLTEPEKMELMKKIAVAFKNYPFIKEIELIPTMYLTPGGSFANLDQLRTMYGIDVVALLSYDQVHYTDEDLRSIGYWTIIGLYTIRGELNETSTMLDAVVFDIPSRKLLFRAPGVSKVKGTATPVNQSEQVRGNAREGFEQAEAQLIVNLKEQLEEFRAKVKESPQEYRIEHR